MLLSRPWMNLNHLLLQIPHFLLSLVFCVCLGRTVGNSVRSRIVVLFAIVHFPIEAAREISEMVSKRQKEARKVFKAANPHLFPKPVEKDPSLITNTKKKKKNGRGKKKNDPTKSSLEANPGDGVGKNRNKNPLRKHPLRVPGMKPGESCFICKGMDHIAKLCPKKSDWERNKTCLHCRQRGHSLKNCPEKAENADRKYCYNCGEAGHSLSNCTHPLQDGGTTYASCFICNEQGHLSKNCPKNTHGIYPKGGSCKICDGITHLAKDCPNKGSKGAVSASGVGRIPKKTRRAMEGETDCILQWR